MKHVLEFFRGVGFILLFALAAIGARVLAESYYAHSQAYKHVEIQGRVAP